MIALGGPVPTFDILAGEGPDYFTLFPESASGFMNLIMFVSSIGWGLGYFGQPHILVRFMAISDAKELKKSTWIAMSWVIISLLSPLPSASSARPICLHHWKMPTQNVSSSLWRLICPRPSSPVSSGPLFLRPS